MTRRSSSANRLQQRREELQAGAVSALDTAELRALTGLIATARAVRDHGSDRKWSELSQIIKSNVLGTTADGRPRKLIVFTEHRDTLTYLQQRLAALMGRDDAVRAIHGGVRRSERRQITEEFTHNPDCQILLATDAAGEGLNLQAAHLMVNYDLPWNPNRIEQRFGRVHRIGQTEVCRLWNLVASNTREGQVFLLLLKIEQQREAYGGRVFDVLGTAFENRPLRELLVEAIRYGEQPEVRAQMARVIDESVSEGLSELLEERALARESLAPKDLAALRRQMEEARTMRLQPHFIGEAFTAAFKQFGGRIVRREAGRFEITNVPASLRGSRRGPSAVPGLRRRTAGSTGCRGLPVDGGGGKCGTRLADRQRAAAVSRRGRAAPHRRAGADTRAGAAADDAGGKPPRWRRDGGKRQGAARRARPRGLRQPDP
ncbi:MAG: helicase-related protein [Patulibacter sp.]